MVKIMKRIIYIYSFTDIAHFKRIQNFLIRKNYKNFNLIILFQRYHKDIEIIKSNIDSINNSCIKIEYLNILDINLIEKIRDKYYSKKINIIIDKNLSAIAFRLCAKLLTIKDLNIIFIEHNLYHHWEYLLSYKTGYRKISFFDLLLKRNTYRLIFISLFSKLRYRIFKRKINIFNIMKFGILPFADEIYLYDKKSYDYFQNNNAFSKIDKSIIDYPFEFIPKMPKNTNFYNICIFSVGLFKKNNNKISRIQIKALKYLINFVQNEYIQKNCRITIKLKYGEMQYVNNLNSEFGKDIDIVENIDDRRDFFHHVIVPIDSFVLIEYLRSDVKIYTYTTYKNKGPISIHASGIFNIELSSIT